MSGSGGLTRDILKWIMSLDLTHSIKNVKRDFANGYLVAEIFSRYYPADLKMNSFDNGISLPRKLDNWMQLEKFFAKRGIPMDRQEIDNVIHCKPGAAVEMVEHIYTFLTKKSVQKAPRKAMPALQVDDQVPAYAKSTASYKIKESLVASELAVKPDVSHTAKTASAVLADHQQALKQEKLADPNRFAPRAHQNRVAAGGVSHKVEKEKAIASVQFKEVNIRPLDRSISQLRTGKSGGSDGMGRLPHHPGTPGSQGAGPVSGGGTAPSGSMFEGHYGSGHTPTFGGSTISALLNQIVGKYFDAQTLAVAGAAQDPDLVAMFVDALPALCEDKRSLQVFGDMSAAAQTLDLIVLQSPQQCVKLFSLFLPGLDLPDFQPVFSAVVAFLVAVGQSMVRRDAHLTWDLFDSYALPKLCQLLKTQLAKRAAILHICYSFCLNDNDTHCRVIRRLQTVLDDPSTFTLVLARLVCMETALQGELLSLYHKHATVGLAQSSPNIRAAALAILSVVAQRDSAAVVKMLDRISTMAADNWWEVQAQVLVVCSSLLTQLSSEDPHTATIYEIIQAIFTPFASPTIQKIGLSSVAPLLSKHTFLYRMFVAVLLSLPEGIRESLLDPHCQVEDIQLLGVPAGTYKVRYLPNEWHSLGVAKAMTDLVKEEKLDNLEKEHVDVLFACLRIPLEEAERSEWAAYFVSMKDYIYVALCDEEICLLTTQVLDKFFTYLGTAALETFSTLATVLRMLYSDGPATCQACTLEFLTAQVNKGDPFKSALADIVNRLPEEIQQSSLQKLKELLSS